MSQSTTISAGSTINGVNVDQLAETVTAIQGSPALGKFEFRPGKGTGESRHQPRLEFVLTYDGENPAPLMDLLGQNDKGSYRGRISPKARDVESWSHIVRVKSAPWKPAESGRGVLQMQCYRETYETNELLEFVQMRFDMDTSEDAGADVELTIVQPELPFEGKEETDGEA